MYKTVSLPCIHFKVKIQKRITLTLLRLTENIFSQFLHATASLSDSHWASAIVTTLSFRSSTVSFDLQSIAAVWQSQDITWSLSLTVHLKMNATTSTVQSKMNEILINHRITLNYLEPLAISKSMKIENVVMFGNPKAKDVQPISVYELHIPTFRSGSSNKPPSSRWTASSPHLGITLTACNGRGIALSTP